MDKQQANRKKRRARGEGVTSYRVTSSLTLTDEAYDHQQRAKQQRAMQPPADPYAQGGQSAYGDPAQAYDGQQGGYGDAAAGYDAQGYYDPNQPADPNAAYAAEGGGYDTQGYYDQNQQAPYDYGQQGYADPNQQAYADPNQQGYYDQGQQAYADPNQQGYYDGQQGYADPNQQGYYDQNQQGYADPNQQGYYDGQQGYADPNQQGYYDGQQGYADPNQQGYYDQNQQGYYDPQQAGYGDPHQPGYYDQGQQGYEDPNAYYGAEVPKRKRKVESVRDVFSQMLGEGHVFATDSEDSPHSDMPGPARPMYPIHGSNGAYPPPHLVPPSPLIQLLGPVAGIYLKLMATWKKLTEKITYYTDMILDMQDSVQKEFKEAMGLAFKGFMEQLRQKSPLALPYQQGGMAPPGAPPGYAAYPAEPPPQLPPVSFVDLHELNVEFTDNYDQPLFDFSKFANSQYKVSKQIVDPAASEGALWAIRECAPRAGAIPPAQEGPYANLPLTEVMNNIGETDLQAFLRYVKAYPGNYVSRNLKISETFATWVVYGAPTP